MLGADRALAVAGVPAAAGTLAVVGRLKHWGRHGRWRRQGRCGRSAARHADIYLFPPRAICLNVLRDPSLSGHRCV